MATTPITRLRCDPRHSTAGDGDAPATAAPSSERYPEGLSRCQISLAASPVSISWRQPARLNSRRRWGLAGLFGVSLVVGFKLLGNHTVAGAEPERPTCSGVHECRTLLTRTELQLDSCVFSCSAEQERFLMAKNLFREALEEQAEQDHRSQVRQLIEQRELQRARADAAREQQALLAAQGRERDHQRQIELLEAQAKQHAAELEIERAGKVRYLTRLTPDQRRERLSACHDRAGTCDELAELLVEAATSPRERRSLVQLHEQRTNGVGPAVGASHGKPAAERRPESASQVNDATSIAQPVPEAAAASGVGAAPQAPSDLLQSSAGTPKQVPTEVSTARCCSEPGCVCVAVEPRLASAAATPLTGASRGVR